MDSTQSSELDYECPPFFRAFKDGRIERLTGEDFVPPTTDPQTGVSSKDVTVDPETSISARLYLPKNLPSTVTAATTTTKKLPLLVYFHGGAFLNSTPFNSTYHIHLNTLVSQANVVAVSVNYRRAPEHPIPAAYEDSWAALQWVDLHRNQVGPEPWLNQHVDFEYVFLGGDSAGANIAHNMAVAIGRGEPMNISILGLALVHPYFWGSKPIGSEAANPEAKALVDCVWGLVCPSSMPTLGQDDPRLNPVVDGGASLVNLGCRRVLICVAEKDVLRDRGWLYYEVLSKNGWMGVVEFEETKGEDHVFHLRDPDSEKAKELVRSLAAFLNRDMPPLI
ncbi:hypothetical protein Ancab_016299 [Ancistrocladus abbreviatus]